MIQQRDNGNTLSLNIMDIDWKHIRPAEFVGKTGSSDGGKIESSDDGKFFQAHKLRFKVPLCHTSEENPEPIELQAELVYSSGPSIVSAANADGKLDIQVVDSTRPNNTKPMVVYLCGGPGDANPAFANPELNKIILKKWRLPILFLDYRGTGESTAVTAAALAERKSPSEYLTLFRQDAIVADLEAIRLCFRGVKFLLVGQSFGGWIAITYVSFLPGSLSGVFITGGLPPIGKGPEDVYTALYVGVIRANKQYYAKYPKDAEKVKEIVKWLAKAGGKDKDSKSRGVALRDEQRLSPQGFMTLGRHFGRGKAGFKGVHFLVTRMAKDIKNGGLASDTIAYFSDSGGAGFKLHKRPCYGTLHEPIYCSGTMKAPPNWAAQDVGRQQRGGHFRWLKKDFDSSVLDMDAFKNVPLYFTREMIHDFILGDTGPAAAPFKEHADDLARRVQWSKLYDVRQLSQNMVPVRALVYPKDLFVDFDFSLQTAAMVRRCQAVPARRSWLHGSVKTRPKQVCRVLFRSDILREG